MDVVDLRNNGLTMMPNLRYNHATRLDISKNAIGLTYAMMFPFNLTILDISEVKMRGVITSSNLPITLEKLTISNNLITHFDGTDFLLLHTMHIDHNNLIKFIYPPNIRILNLSHNNLSYLEELPPFLEEIEFTNNKVAYLPIMNGLLASIDFAYNEIKNIDDLPDSVEYLGAASNRLREINKLPYSLINLMLDNNMIHTICDMPDSIIMACLNHNFLQKFPRLGKNVERLEIKHNNIDTIYSHNLPFKLGFLDISDNPIKYLHSHIKVRAEMGMKLITDSGMKKIHYGANYDEGDTSPLTELYDGYDNGFDEFTQLQDDFGPYRNGYDNYEQFSNNNYGNNYYNNNNNNFGSSFFDNYEYSQIDTNASDPLCVSVYNMVKVCL